MRPDLAAIGRGHPPLGNFAGNHGQVKYRMTGPKIARRLRMARSTVAAVLKRERLSRIRDLEPPPRVIRYERERPGELIHLDIKKLGRIERIGHRWLRGTHHGVGPGHLQAYLDEFTFRFNRRRTPMAAFQTLLGLATAHAPATYKMLYGSEPAR